MSRDYGPDDDVLHAHDGRAGFNDSVYLNFASMSDDDVLGGVVRVGLRPVEGYGEFQLCLVLGNGSTLYWASARAPTGPGAFVAGSRNWAVGPLRISAEPSGLAVEYDSAETRRVTDARLMDHVGQALKVSDATPVRVALRFRPTRPIHTMSPSGDMIPGEDAAKDHYEQFGAVSGSVEVGRERLAVRAHRSLRDHSWGPRHYASSMSNMDWLTAHLAGDTDLVGFRIRSRPDLPAQGVVVTGGRAEWVDRVEVVTDWHGQGRLIDPLTVDVRAGTAVIPMRASVERSFMIRHRSASRTVHNSYSLVRYESALGPGRGWVDLNRPVLSPAAPAPGRNRGGDIGDRP